ncbi:YolD-like family protein [Anaerostipes sp.]|uniref:YolD-like family protein n=1 Tax=Anaerostipes sp. TaxID=1872530 RepID=UPI0025BEA864|nr:YolD-like family protein [Anaerostipes sp.]MBS7008079.1 YolD-like family protein [Anaerostipes sp.]
MKADRARQFLPFAALKGYDEMLREIERETEPKRELTEEDARRLNEEIKTICKGMRVHIIYYKKDVYAETEGTVSFIDTVFRKIFVGKEEISFDDIWHISGCQ